jgi:hypothetical protein
VILDAAFHRTDRGRRGMVERWSSWCDSAAPGVPGAPAARRTVTASSSPSDDVSLPTGATGR